MPLITVRDVSEEVRARVEPAFNTLFEAASGSNGFALSRTCAHVLLECVRYMPDKRAEREVLSTTTVFLTALLIARNLAANDRLRQEDQPGDEVQRLHSWGEVLRADYSDQLDTMAADFFETVPSPDIDEFEELAPADQFAGIILGHGLRRTIDGLSGLQEVRATDTVLRSLEDPATGLSKRIAAQRLSGVAEALERLVKMQMGRLPEMVRDASDEELALGVKDYAKSLATILRTAKGEFTFALFGPWGSGKTRLTQVLTPLLESPKRFRDATSAPELPFAELRYEVTVHNAWKYRQPPEAWIYLYKSLVERACAKMDPIDRLALAARAAHFRFGSWPLAGALSMLALLGIPLNATLQLVAIAGSLLGAGALAPIAAITPKVQMSFGS